ncbi:hypothetical protein [uncultured Anaerovibrio sp.]|uniref:hypothetical protein n=1 Tax=uncultured Anaerovibrio sp. TaxID=361586 RepID=UPI0025F5393C|nr:hypothetical protein [uncultured Anaerovibrio sp.]
MFKKIVLCLLSLTVLLGVASIVDDSQRLKTVQAKELEQHIWFYSDHGMDYWITHAEKLDENKYNVSTIQTHNGKMGTFHICDVMYKDGVAYISYLNRSNGTWGEWEQLDIAEALWKALMENY